MTKQQTKFKKAVAIAKQLRKSNPAMKYTDAIKKAFKSLGSTTHKDTKSHNVNVRVVSGTKNTTLKKLENEKKLLVQSIAFNGKLGEHFYSKSEILEKKKQLKSINEKIRKMKNKKVGATLLLEKGETARTKPKSIKTITRTKAGTFKKWKTIGDAPGFSDPVAADEIRTYADNNSQLYYSRRMPILKNLYKKWKKGTYKTDLAAKLWKYYIEDAMQRYQKEFGSRGEKWHQLLSVADRKLLATDYAKQTMNDFLNYNYTDEDFK